METGVVQCINKGMQRDYSADKASQEYAYENHNIRIATTGNETFLSVTNERSTEEIQLIFSDGSSSFNDGSIILGNAVIDDTLILFVTDGTYDYIYKINIDQEFKEGNVTILYEGNLNFNVNNPIECVVSYESKEIQKVYWVDGINQPRVINVCKEYPSNYDFSFSPKLPFNINVDVSKVYEGSGNFTSGVVQYFITLYTKFGPESKIAYMSPLYYITENNKGSKVNDINNCAFNINIEYEGNITYDSIRVYSVVRNSLEGTKNVSIVKDVNISSDNGKVNIIDTNTNLIPVDDSKLLFVGGNTIIASTIEQKHNTLFLGNIKESANTKALNTLKETLSKHRNLDIEGKPIEYKQGSETLLNNILGFGYKAVSYNTDSTNNYKFQLDFPSDWIKTFKSRELYRIGLQFQNHSGEWTQTVWLQDIINKDLYPHIGESPDWNDDLTLGTYWLNKEGNTTMYLPYVRFNPIGDVVIDGELYPYASTFLLECKKEYKNYRLVMAQPTVNDRTIVAQGYVSPTIFNLGDRLKGNSFAQNSWVVRPMFNNKIKHLDNINEIARLETYGDSPKGGIGTNFNSEIFVPSADNYIEHCWISADSVENKYVLKSIDINLEMYRDMIIHALVGFPLYRHSSKCAIVFNIQNTISNTVTSIPVKNYETILIVETLKKTYKKIKSKVLDTKFDSDILNALKTGLNDNSITYDSIGLASGSKVFNSYDFIPYDPDNNSTEAKKKAVSYLKNKNQNATMNFTKRVLRNAATSDWIDDQRNKYKDNYFLDATTIAFYSPDLEAVKNNIEDVKFRIVGKTDINSIVSDYIITNEEGTDIKDINNFNEVLKFNASNHFDNDDAVGLKSYPFMRNANNDRLFNISMWHKKGSLVNNTDAPLSNLKSKTYANLWYCDSTEYIFTSDVYTEGVDAYSDDVLPITSRINWEPPFGVKDLKFVDTDLTSINDNNIYHKNVDTGLIYTNPATEDDLTLSPVRTTFFEIKGDISKEAIETATPYLTHVKGTVNIPIQYSSTNHAVFTLPNVFGQMCPLPGYYNESLEKSQDINMLIKSADITRISSTILYVSGLIYNVKDENTNELSISFVTEETIEVNKYYTIVDTEKNKIVTVYIQEEVSHLNDRYLLRGFEEVVYSGEVDDNGTISYIVPYTDKENKVNRFVSSYRPDDILQSSFSKLGGNYRDNNISFSFGFANSQDGLVSGEPIFNFKTWLPPFNSDTTHSIASSTSLSSSLWICELYKDANSMNPYGGIEENSLETNTFIPISQPAPVGEPLYGFEGDTYYQRWDSLRTYPLTEDKENNVVDVVSLMVETHTNIEGRTDDWRHREDIINVRPSNIIETINPVYSQSNNYITSAILDSKYNNLSYPNTFVWSMKKSNMEDIDVWCNINMLSSDTLDGNKGVINKIKTWNDYLLAFQDKAIAVINYDVKSIINSSDGIPIEVANSGKVGGYTYLSTTIGCKNKWSIVESPYGLYFIDSYNKSINIFGSGGLKSLSTNQLFQDWIVENEKNIVWNPTNNGGFKSFYDSKHNDVYFINDKTALCYSELLGQFLSFYDYERLNTMVQINDNIYGIKDNNIHSMFTGNTYCNLFGEQKDYFMIYKVTKESFIDKIWTNIEYRADVFKEGDISNNNSLKIINETFDTLDVWNEYQTGTTNLKFKQYPNAKNKFRIWRTDIPRATGGRGLDRMRNPWIMLKLIKNTNTNNRMEFHDLLVKYLK